MGERTVNNSSKPDRTKLAVAGGLAIILASVVMRMFSSGPDESSRIATAAATMDKPASITIFCRESLFNWKFIVPPGPMPPAPSRSA